jgi:predicted protein tyrosine phosphatase
VYEILKNRLATSAYEELKNVYDKWNVLDVRSLNDDGSNKLIDYASYVLSVTHLCHLDPKRGVVIACDAGQSRSNAIALGHLVHHYKMDFYDAWEMVKKYVPVAQIDPSHISALKKLFGVTVP